MLIDVVGSGRFGVVYLAHDRLTLQDVAVKILFGPEEHTSVVAPRERIALLALDVPGVVRLFDSGTFEGRPYLVTEYFAGLRFPGAAPPLPWADVVEPATALLEALARVHASRVVHGDLKPGNVLVNSHGQLRIVDLGVAVGDAVLHAGIDDQGWGGTLPYLAPELLDNAAPCAPTAHTDLYAAGVLLFEALTGRLPHRCPPDCDARHDCADRKAFADRRAGMPADLAPLREVDLPHEARRLIARLLQHDPARRPATAAHALSMLRGTRPPMERVASLVAERFAGSRPDSAIELRSLFHGPDRLLWLQTDAADILWARAGGDLSALVDELSQWARAGLAQLDGERLRVTREQLGRVRQLSPVEGPPTPIESDLPTEASKRLLDLVVAAGGHATRSVARRRSADRSQRRARRTRSAARPRPSRASRRRHVGGEFRGARLAGAGAATSGPRRARNVHGAGHAGTAAASDGVGPRRRDRRRRRCGRARAAGPRRRDRGACARDRRVERRARFETTAGRRDAARPRARGVRHRPRIARCAARRRSRGRALGGGRHSDARGAAARASCPVRRLRRRPEGDRARRQRGVRGGRLAVRAAARVDPRVRRSVPSNIE